MLDKCKGCHQCLNACIVCKMGYDSLISCLVKKTVSKEIWNCTNCWMCCEKCPQNINLWLAKANLQRKNPPPAAVTAGIRNISKYGFVFPVNEESNESREIMGLARLILPDAEVIAILTAGQ